MKSEGRAAGDKRSSLSGYVRERIKRAIYEGQFQPGARLRESEICKWLKVSRTPVREGIMALMAEGLLAALPTRGTVVNELDRQQVIELYAMRGAVEGTAARLAARLMSDADIDFLDEINVRSEQTDDARKQAQLNRKFHETILAACHNRYLTATVNSLEAPLALLNGTTYSVPGRAQTAHEEHRALIAALRQRDADAAEKIAREHLRAAERARLKMMSEML
jgi:DNA-binding GntR family transcriptional regulator